MARSRSLGRIMLIVTVVLSVCMTCGVELLYLRARVQLKRAEAACTCCGGLQVDGRRHG